MTTSGQRGGRLRYSPISVHTLHADSAGATLAQQGGRFQYCFWTNWYIIKSDSKKVFAFGLDKY